MCVRACYALRQLPTLQSTNEERWDEVRIEASAASTLAELRSWQWVYGHTPTFHVHRTIADGGDMTIEKGHIKNASSDCLLTRFDHRLVV